MSKLSGIFPVPHRFGIRHIQVLIDSLPNEVLCQILKTAIETTLPLGVAHRVRKHELATVCRRWRDIILNTPLFWTFIQISPEWLRTSLLKAHVARSRECPLVIICLGSNWISAKASYYAALLDIVIATSHRWRSLTITDNYGGFKFVIARLGRTVFPLLTHCVSIAYAPFHITQLAASSRIPVSRMCPRAQTSGSLRYGLYPPPFPSALEELAIGSPDYPLTRTPCFLQLPSVQGLRALSFRGHTGEWRIQHNSIYLPLTRLSFDVSHAEQLLRVLSVPRLTHVDYQQRNDETLFAAFNGISSKWTNVHELRLKLPLRTKDSTPEDYHAGLEVLCLAAPEVRGMEVVAEDLDELLECGEGLYPIDH